MVLVPTWIGEVGAFIFNLIVLSLLIKYNKSIEKYNSTRPAQLKSNPVKKQGLVAYFLIWVIASLVSWYYLEYIKLGEFFALSVVAPAVIVLFLEWIQVLR